MTWRDRSARIRASYLGLLGRARRAHQDASDREVRTGDLTHSHAGYSRSIVAGAGAGGLIVREVTSARRTATERGRELYTTTLIVDPTSQKQGQVKKLGRQRGFAKTAGYARSRRVGIVEIASDELRITQSGFVLVPDPHTRTRPQVVVARAHNPISSEFEPVSVEVFGELESQKFVLGAAAEAQVLSVGDDHFRALVHDVEDVMVEVELPLKAIEPGDMDLVQVGATFTLLVGAPSSVTPFRTRFNRLPNRTSDNEEAADELASKVRSAFDLSDFDSR